MVEPKGYKQTEVGVIPDDWEVKKLGEVGDVKMCRRIFNSETSENGRVPFYKIGTFGKDPDAYITWEKYEDYRRKYPFPRKGDILISAAGTIGRTVIYDGSDAYFQDSNIVWLDNNSKIVTNEFLHHIYQIVKYNTEGGTIQRLYNSILKSASFSCPPLPEQTAIAEVLSDMDALIAQTEKLIEKKKAIKQGVMQELLKPKEGWETRKLGEFGKTFGGITGKTKSDFGIGDASYIPFMNIMNNPIINLNFLEKVNIKSNEGQNKVQIGDLFFNGSSETPEEVGFCSILDSTVENVYLNSFCFGYRMFNLNELNGHFLAYFFRSPLGRSLIFSLAQGATRYNLSKTNLLKLELPLPNKNEQDQIAKILIDVDLDIKAQNIKLQKLKLQKQGMMQALLTGKIRLGEWGIENGKL